MAKDKLTEYDATANNNTVVGDVNLAENSALPSDMNNAVREIMSHQKEAFGSGTPLYVDQTNNRVGVNKTPTVALDVTGTIATDGLTLGDAESILLGASSDMQIIHDGSNSIISDNGTGNLVLRSNATAVEIDFNTDETSALFNHNGSVELYHDNTKKFETTSGGATVTGYFNATSGLQINGNNASGRIQQVVQASNGSTVSIGTGYTNVTTLAVTHLSTEKVIICSSCHLDTQSSSSAGHGDFRILATNTSQSADLGSHAILAESARLRWFNTMTVRDHRGISSTTTYHLQVRKFTGSMTANGAGGTSTLVILRENPS